MERCDRIRLVFAHPFPLNCGAPFASANFISDGKVQVSTYGVASSYTLMMKLAQLMGAPFFKTNGWAQSGPYPVSPFTPRINMMKMHQYYFN